MPEFANGKKDARLRENIGSDISRLVPALYLGWLCRHAPQALRFALSSVSAKQHLGAVFAETLVVLFLSPLIARMKWLPPWLDHIPICRGDREAHIGQT